MQHIEYLSESSVTLPELSSIFLFFPFLVFIGEFLLVLKVCHSLHRWTTDWRIVVCNFLGYIIKTDMNISMVLQKHKLPTFHSGDLVLKLEPLYRIIMFLSFLHCKRSAVILICTSTGTPQTGSATSWCSILFMPTCKQIYAPKICFWAVARSITHQEHGNTTPPKIHDRVLSQLCLNTSWTRWICMDHLTPQESDKTLFLLVSALLE